MAAGPGYPVMERVRELGKQPILVEKAVLKEIRVRQGKLTKSAPKDGKSGPAER